MSLIAAIGAALVLSGGGQDEAGYSDARTRPWHVGDERETTAGGYSRLFDEFEGWRIWRSENRLGVVCSAVKPAENTPDPMPHGGRAFFGASLAFLVVYEAPGLGRPYLQWRLLGERIHVDTEEYREVGTRFYSARPALMARPRDWMDVLSRDGQQLDFHIVSWRYPAIREGRAEASGIVNLTGLDQAITRMEQCRAS